MKNRLLFLLLASSLLLACDDDNKTEEPGENGGKGEMLNPEAKLTISGKKQDGNILQGRANKMSYEDSLAFITRYAWEWRGISKKNDNQPTSRAFDFTDEYGTQRDTVNNKFILWGVDIVELDGKLGWFVTDLSDFVIITLITPDGTPAHPKTYHGTLDLVQDTIAYVPNKVILEARRRILEAHERKDYEECYRLFDSAFVFIPTTGAKWRAMKAAGIE